MLVFFSNVAVLWIAFCRVLSDNVIILIAVLIINCYINDFFNLFND